MRYTTGLLAPFVGSKADVKKYPVHDGGQYDATVEPFGGSGHFTTRHLDHIGRAFVAERDPTVWAVWYCWLRPELRRRVDAELIRWQGEVIQDAEAAFETLSDFIDTTILAAGLTSTSTIVALAAARITIGKLNFGAVVRCNATEGKLNISLSEDKRSSFEARHNSPQLSLVTREEINAWVHHWRPLPPEVRVNLFTHWRHVCQALERSSVTRAIALVDPIYWLPYEPGTDRRGSGAMSPAYPGHQPSAEETFGDCVDCAEWLLATGKVKRLVLTNYISDPLGVALADLSGRYGIDFEFSNLGPLSTMNKRQAAKTENEEGAWEFGGRRMFRDRVPDLSVQQLSIA
jgi:hypothetical protein